MIKWLENLYQGALGRLLRAALTTGIGVVISHYGQNEWYIALGPFLQLVGKKLRDKYPGVWEWLPF
jgi:hypothetical protein